MSLLMLALSLQLGPASARGEASAVLAAYEEEQALARDARAVICAYERFSDRAAAELARVVVGAAREHGLSPSLVLAVIHTESGFRPQAVSPVGAEGLMQIRPLVGEWLAEQRGEPWSGERPLFDPFLNVRLGVYYLAQLARRFEDVDLALIAYNWGPARVREVLRTRGELPEAMWGYPRRVWRAYAGIKRQRPACS